MVDILPDLPVTGRGTCGFTLNSSECIIQIREVFYTFNKSTNVYSIAFFKSVQFFLLHFLT